MTAQTDRERWIEKARRLIEDLEQFAYESAIAGGSALVAQDLADARAALLAHLEQAP